MNRVVYKYRLTEVTTILDLPKGAQPLHFAWQGNSPTMWALVDIDQPAEHRTFLIVGTGQPEFGDDKVRFIGSTLINDGHYVFHLFEVLPAPVTPAHAVHAAEPGVVETQCKHCGADIHRVTGGHGRTYIHTATGTVAAPTPVAVS